MVERNKNFKFNQRRGVETAKYVILVMMIAFLYSIGYAQEEAQVKEPVSADVLLFIEDELPQGATATGSWQWDKDTKLSGNVSHTDGAGNGLHSHSCEISEPVKLADNSIIEQFVYLDPNNKPKGIMLKLMFKNKEELDLYWEAEEEVFVDTLEYMKAWYMGFLPEAGAWQKLVINIKELEIKPSELISISFITYDGRSFWDKTLITQNSK